MTDSLVDPESSGEPADDEPGRAESGVTIVVCNSCRSRTGPETEPRPGSLLARATAKAAADTDIDVRQVACLGNCNRGLSVAFLRTGCWSYVFGELDTHCADDLVVAAKLFAQSQDGFMPFWKRPQSLKGGLIARIPSFESLKDLP
ncbi:MAG: DUF1636 family protein [Dongiaceae bacterium]